MGQRRPHIVVVMADDLGWSGVGFNMQQEQAMLPAMTWVQTPTLDTLARNGVVLKRHYAGKSCAPSRSSFLSGRFPFHVNQNNPRIEQPFMGVPLNMSTIADVLSEQGYETYHVGKWHLGMHSEQLLPLNRGFKDSLAMLGGSMDYFTLQSGWPDKHQMTDLWLNGAPAKPRLDEANADAKQCVKYSVRGEGSVEQCKPYATNIFMDYALEKVRSHDTNKPMFMYLALQNVHSPHQVPTRFLDAYSEDDFPVDSPRRYGFAMVTALDEAIRKLQAELVAKAMWQNTLLVFTSDNGGKTSEAPNYPLRGGKGSVFDGGVRVASLVAGGFLPDAMRGRKLDGLIHMCDWWATFAGLAGVEGAKVAGFMDPSSQESVSIPHRVKRVDSLDMWPYISGEVLTSPRKVVHVSYDPTDGRGALIAGRWKLVVGAFGSFYPKPTSPDPAKTRKLTDHNSSRRLWSVSHDCGTAGCLFDLQTDEREINDLQSSEVHGAVLKAMQDMYAASANTHFQAHFVNGLDRLDAKTRARENGKFWSPWQRDLPPGSMTDWSLNGREMGNHPGTKDAQACSDLCAHEDACIGWQFKQAAPNSEEEDAFKDRCVLYDRLNSEGLGSVKIDKEYVSGVKNEAHIDIKDEQFLKSWVDMNEQAAAISQEDPTARRLWGETSTELRGSFV